MNNKGFTLIELLATIVLLVLVMGISAFAIVSVINNSKEKNYDLLITNIKDGAEVYYQECKYANNSGITCSSNGNVSLGDLVKYGYVKGNDQDNKGKYSLVNPNDNEPINSCVINVAFSGGKVRVSAVTTSGSCPTEY